MPADAESDSSPTKNRATTKRLTMTYRAPHRSASASLCRTVDPKRYQQIKDVLHEAADLTGAERAAFLETACRGDADLRAEVERLLETEDAPTGGLLLDSADGAALGLSPGGRGAVVPESLGPYRLHEELGRGGMGVVHAATDTRDGSTVAVKLIYPALLARPVTLKRFRREAKLGRKVDHENVVRTLDVVSSSGGGAAAEDAAGEDAGAPGVHALVMEYVRGRTLRALLRDWGSVPEALLREIGVQASAGLEAMHAVGIVHRDLKPENVLVTEDQRVRIMDLGIARAMNPADATIALTGAGQFLGTLGYAAPEQFGGGDVGPAADLYALGVTLYELATGGNPNDVTGPAAALGARPAIAPLSDVAAISPMLSAVIETLMARRPIDRFASAAELHEVLLGAEDSAWWQGRLRRARSRSRPLPQLAVRRETRLRGRDAELLWMADAWKAARDGQGSALLLLGEAGIGKTRVVDAFLQGSAGGDSHVLYGSVPHSGGLRGITSALVAHFGTDMEERLAELLDDPPARIAAHVALLGAHGVTQIDDVGPADGLAALCSRIFRALAAERPTVWIVEDLHFAPAEVRATALALARACDGHQALVLLTSRGALPTADRSQLLRLPRYAERELARLPAEEVAGLVREALGSDGLAERLGPHVAQRSDGVPLFVFELLRAMEEHGTLQREDGGGYVLAKPIRGGALTSAVHDLISDRLGDLSQTERETLDAASIQGFEFDAALVAAALGRPFVRVLQDLAESERRHRIVRSAGRGHRFDHHLFQEVVYAELPEVLRREYHGALADALAKRAPSAGDAPGALVRRIAYHHLHGNRPREALPLLDDAILHLRGRRLPEEAIGLVDAALAREGVITGRRRIKLLLEAADLHDLLGRRDAESAAAEAALSGALGLEAPDLIARAHATLGRLAIAAFDGETAVSHRTAALEAARRVGDPQLEVAMSRGLGRALICARRVDEAHDVLERALATARSLDDRHTEAMVHTDIALSHANAARYADALEPLDRACKLLREVGDARERAVAVSRRGSAYLGLARYDDARRDYEESLALARESGDRALVASSRGRLGLIALHAGRLEDARRDFRAHHDSGVEIGDPSAVGQALANLCHTEALLGNADEALELAQRSAELGAAIEDRRLVGFAHIERAYTFRQAGRAEQCKEAALLSKRVSSEGGDPGIATIATLELGVLALELGDTVEAEARMTEALAMADERGDAVGKLYTKLYLAQLRGTGAEALVGDVARVTGMLGVAQSMHAWYALWRATSDPDHLQHAHSRLRHLHDHAPADRRDRMIKKVPMHAHIWGEAQA